MELTTPTVESLTKRGFLTLEDSEWEQAKAFFNKALDINPEYAPAHAGLLCVELKLTSEEALAKCRKPFDNISSYVRALRFADAAYKVKLEGYARENNERIVSEGESEAEEEQADGTIAIYDWLIAEFKKDTGIDLGQDSTVQQRLREASEKARIELSTMQAAEVNLPFIAADKSGPKHLQKSLTRAEFEQMVSGLMNRTKSSNEGLSMFTLLLAEDAEINREVLCDNLENSHINIECAENGARAVELFTAAPEKFDIILMDVQMPVMNGISATFMIRAMAGERAKAIPIVAMLASASGEEVDKCMKAGMNDYLEKPIDSDLLLEMLNKYLQ